MESRPDAIAAFVALRLAGLSAFDAACHTLAALGTGGCSKRTASVAGFNDPVVELILLVILTPRFWRRWGQRLNVSPA